MVRVKKPAWLEGLMRETSFFRACGAHETLRKNEKNVFCLSCCVSLCPHCLPSHPSHPLLQVRRYVYHDVVRLDNLQKLIDCSYIQPYTINGAKVIFLNDRPQSRACKGSGNVCITCDRILQEPFHFCSLSCKVNHMVYQGEDLSCVLRQFNNSDFSFSQFEGLHMENSEMDDEVQTTIGNSILEEQLQFTTSPSSSNTISLGSSNISEGSDFMRRKKKANDGFLPGIVLSFTNRRKSAPHRSPLC